MTAPEPPRRELNRSWKGDPLRAPRRAERVKLWVLTLSRAALSLAILARIGDRRATILVALIGLGYCWTRGRAVQSDAAAIATSRNILDRLWVKLAGLEERRSEWILWWRNGRGTAAVILSEAVSLRIVALICIAFLWRSLHEP